MPQIVWRIIVVVVVGLFLMLVGPLLLGFLGLDINGQGLQIIRICLGFGALCYIIWGPPVRPPNP